MSTSFVMVHTSKKFSAYDLKCSKCRNTIKAPACFPVSRCHHHRADHPQGWIYVNQAQRDLLTLIMELDMMEEMTQELLQLKNQIREMNDVADLTTNMDKMDVQSATASESFSINDGDDNDITNDVADIEDEGNEF
ncbi:hypothetical protein AeRB84_019956 [Aphanomyces euteiches]|nr:hypothetical protein AeRB84_019956 [Aphanomyces euteiches]